MVTKYAKRKENATFPIRITNSLAKKLKDFGVMGETYSDVIERLLFKKKEKEDNEQPNYMAKVD